MNLLSLKGGDSKGVIASKGVRRELEGELEGVIGSYMELEADSWSGESKRRSIRKEVCPFTPSGKEVLSSNSLSGAITPSNSF